MSPKEKIGLIAGKGDLPIILAQQLIKSGYKVYVIGFINITHKSIEKYATNIYWVSLGSLQPIIDFFHTEKISKAVLAGLIRHEHIFEPIQLDTRAKAFFNNLADMKAMSILSSFANELLKDGIQLLPMTNFLLHLIPERGILTNIAPDKKLMEDIAFGKNIAKKIAALDIGQTVVVKNKAILAVESIEGTDRCILRGGKLGKKDTVVVKVARPQQDLRFDLPIIGYRTIQTMKKAKAKVLAIEARKSIILAKEKTIQIANAAGIIVIAI